MRVVGDRGWDGSDTAITGVQQCVAEVRPLKGVMRSGLPDLQLSHQLAVARTEHAVLTTNVEVVEKLLRVRDDCISLLEQARGDADTRLELGPRCPRLHGLTLGQLGLLDVIYSHRHALSEVVRMASG